MSSKSRKHSSQSRPQRRPTEPEVHPAGEHHESVRVGGLEVPDEAIHVPKDRNPLFFVLMIALLIFLLIIFIVPGALLGAAGGGGGQTEGAPDYVTFRVPTAGGGEELVEIDRGSFVRRRLTIDKVLEFDPFLLLPLGIFGGRGNDLEEEDHARLVALDRLAESAGVYVPQEDLIAHLRALLLRQGMNPETYKQYFLASRDNISASDFEDELARMLRVRRFLTMVGEIPRLPDPGWIEEAWNDEHVAERYQYAALPVEPLVEEVRAEGIDDEALQAWFDQREEFERNRYLTEERRVVTFAYVDELEAFDATALLAKYPGPADADPTERAREYYNSVFLDRFLRATASTDEQSSDEQGPDEQAGTGDEAGEGEAAEDANADANEDQPAEPQSEFLEFDEVQAIAEREAPVYFALEAWLEDMQDRALAGEEVDLVAEAEALGVETTTTEALTGAELRELERFGVGLVAETAARTNEGDLAAAPFVTEDTFGVLRVDAVAPPVVPPVGEIRDEVFEDWVVAEAKERALDQLRTIRDGFELVRVDEEAEEPRIPLQGPDGEELPFRTTDAEAFRQAIEAAGLEVRVRDWLDRRGRPADDPDAEDPAHVFLRSGRIARDSQAAEVGEVLPPALDAAGDTAYLVRKDGERPVPIEEMTPQDYASYKTRSVNSAPSEIRNAFDYAYLQQSYGLTLKQPEPDPADRRRRGDDQQDAAADE